MLKEVLDACLTGEQREAGFHLEEEEDFLNLLWRGKVVAVFSAYGATVKAVRDVADRRMAKAQ